MKRRPKPEPVLAEGERPPCGFRWFYGDGDCACEDRPYQHAHGCGCGRRDSEHSRFQGAMHAGLVAERIERKENVMRRVVDRALAATVRVRQRRPMRTGVLRENGKSRRYGLDGMTIDLNEPGE